MALYVYHAFAKDGKKVQGIIDAPSLTSVKEQLSRQGIFPISIALSFDASGGSFFKRIFTRAVSTKEKILFTKQLATLLKSGIPLLQSLELLTEQLEGQLRTITVSIKDEVKEGTSFANALNRFPKVFETIYVQLVRAGEASGNLEVILIRLMEYLERRDSIQRKVKNALRYPLIQLSASLIVVIGLIIFVVPSMTETLAAQGQQMPTLTRIMVAIADILIGYYLAIIVGLCTITGLYYYWSTTPRGRRTLDSIKLHVPLVKQITKTNAVVQFCYTLGMLLEGGVNLAEALDIVCAVIDNRILTDTLMHARDNIVKQGKIAQYLKQTEIFPPVAIYLIQTGEETGQLDAMLLTVARNYEEELRDLIDRLIGAISPIMLIIVGLLIAIIILSIMMPVFEMMNSGGMDQVQVATG